MRKSTKLMSSISLIEKSSPKMKYTTEIKYLLYFRLYVDMKFNRKLGNKG